MLSTSMYSVYEVLALAKWLDESSDPTDPSLDSTVSDEEDFPQKHSRSSAPMKFSTGKEGHTSKTRRYIPTTRRSDDLLCPIHGSNGKGAKHRKNRKNLNRGFHKSIA